MVYPFSRLSWAIERLRITSTRQRSEFRAPRTATEPPGTRLTCGLIFGVFIFRRRLDPWQRSFLFPKRKSACRACAQPREQCGQRAAIRDPHPPKSSLLFSVLYDEWSWAALQKFRFRFGILIHGPMICQRPVHIKEIGPAALESPYYIGARDIMTALPDAASNAPKCELRRVKTKIDYFDQIALVLPILDPLRVVPAAQRTFKCELGFGRYQTVELPEN